MSSPTDSEWSLVSRHEQQIEEVRKRQETLLEDAAAISAANPTNGRRLGTSRTQYQIEEPGTSTVGFPSALPLAPSSSISAPIPVPAATNGSSRRGSKKPPPSAFPKMDEGDGNEREPSKPSFVRKLKSSLVGGKNPFLSGSKSGSKEKQELATTIPTTRSPEPDAVLVHHSVDAESNALHPPLSAPPAPPKSSHVYQQPPVTASAQPLHTFQSYPVPSSSSTTPGQSSGESSTPELVQSIPLDPPPKPRSVPIIELPPRTRTADRSGDPVVGALQTHRSAPGKAMYSSTNSGSSQPEIRPLPQVPNMPPRQPPTTASTSRSHQAATAALNAMINPIPNPLPTPPAPAPAPTPAYAPPPASAPLPAAPPTHPPSTTSSRPYHRDTSAFHANASSPPVVRYPTSGDRTSHASRTSYTTTATTPSLSSSRTHGSTSASETHVPPKGVERVNWDTAPPTRLALGSSSRRAASTDQLQVTADDVWNDSMAQISSRPGQPRPQPQPQSQSQEHQAGYHIEMSSAYRNAMAPPPTNEATRPRYNKLQRQATAPASAPPTTVTYVYYDPEPPLISHSSRLSDLKEDYRNPGSERSAIIRRKINFLRFELGYTGLRRSRGDGNCFYRSFAFAWLTQIYHADDRAVAVISALEHLEVAQNYVDLAISGHPLSMRMYVFLQGIIRGMELRSTDQKSLLKVFQNRQQSDDIVAYVRLITSAYIRLMPEMHGSIFHPDDPLMVISPLDFCAIYVEQLGQDADHIQISALSRALNTCVYIYRLDDSVGGTAPNEQDIPAHCTRFIPPDLPPVTEPVTLLFRPGHYDILERDRATH